MRDNLSGALSRFTHGCDRALQLCDIQGYLEANAPKALDCSDILRASVVLAVSSFDLLVHDIYRTEVVYRISARRDVQRLRLPFSAIILPANEIIPFVDSAIRTENSYKSFVAPDKLADILKHLLPNPWDSIGKVAGADPDELKGRLRGIVDLRNRIAHEADIDPSYAGISLWPIYKDDVVEGVRFLRQLGIDLTGAVDKA